MRGPEPGIVWLSLIRRMLSRIVPLADAELSRWWTQASRIPDQELRRQALASLSLKRFHSVGGSAYALFLPRAEIRLIRPIVALQTISDYLDNLCDRSTSLSGVDFRQLHTAMLDAVRPGAFLRPYYRFHPEKDDGGYLNQLVQTCQRSLSFLPYYRSVQRQVVRYVRWYNDLQEFKHIAPEQRLTALESWFARWQPHYPDLAWWEFAAACGSTLGIFALWAVAATPAMPSPALAPKETGDSAGGTAAARADGRAVSLVKAVDQAYFPWISGLHILLDYYIDQSEDQAGGDLNLVSFYPDPEARLARLSYFYEMATRHAAGLPSGTIHTFIVNGLPALYLTDPKVALQHYEPERDQFFSHTPRATRLLFRTLSILRRVPGLASPASALPV